MPDILHQIQIAAKPGVIFPLFTTAAGFAQWWTADIHESSDAVRRLDLAFFNRRTVYRLRPETFVAPTHAAWRCETGQEWVNTVLSFALQSRESAQILRFSHSGWEHETDYFVSCNTAWGELLFRLKAAAEGHPRGPLFLADSLAY